MKKQTALTLALLIALGGLAAYSAIRERQSETDTTVRFDEAMVYESSENSIQTTKSVTFIGEEKAKELIAEHIGVAVALIDFSKIELDEDNDVWKYEVELCHNEALYEAEVNAENGEIIKWETKE